MTNPITPPPELVQQWLAEFYGTVVAPGEATTAIAIRAAQWGADKELEACCEHMRDYQWGFVERPDGTKIHRAVYLQQSRRSKPPSLKEQALYLLDKAEDPSWDINDFSIIRRALEQLDDIT